MYITKEKLLELYACEASVIWFEQNPGITTVEQGIQLLWETDHHSKFNWSNWILSRTLNHHNQVKYAVHAAEIVLPIWEKEFPEDKKPHEAINAAKAWINDPSEVNTEKCRQTARAAADAAGYAAAYAAAADAAEAVGWAACAAANANAALAAAYADPTKAKEIIDYGLSLLQNQE